MNPVISHIPYTFHFDPFWLNLHFPWHRQDKPSTPKAKAAKRRRKWPKKVSASDLSVQLRFWDWYGGFLSHRGTSISGNLHVVRNCLLLQPNRLTTTYWYGYWYGCNHYYKTRSISIAAALLQLREKSISSGSSGCVYDKWWKSHNSWLKPIIMLFQ